MSEVTDTELTHNPLNGVTAAVWRRGDVVHKVLTGRRPAPEGWMASDEPRHWNYWRREALVYQSGLAERLGLGAPRALGVTKTVEGDIELRLEYVEGRHAGALTVEDLCAAAESLGRAQGRRDLPVHPWLSRGFLRAYSGSRDVSWRLLGLDEAWAQPLVAEHFPPELRAELLHLHERREWLLGLMETLPRTVCHLDAWPQNLVRRRDGEIALLDWAFVGDGALGEDVGNLVPDSVFDLLLPHQVLDELDTKLTAAYLRGLCDAGWHGDDRLVRLGICASAVKYDWLTVRCLEQARADRHLDYGGRGTVDADARFAARAAGLSLLARWVREAEELAASLRL
jgi:hypothetical protein